MTGEKEEEDKGGKEGSWELDAGSREVEIYQITTCRTEQRSMGKWVVACSSLTLRGTYVGRKQEA